MRIKKHPQEPPARLWDTTQGEAAMVPSARGWNTEDDNVPYSLIGPDFAQRPAMAAIRAWNAERQNE